MSRQRHLWLLVLGISGFLYCSLESTQPAAQDKVALPQTEQKVNPSTPFLEPFTGRVKKDRVRMRLAPTYDGVIVKELKQNDLLVIVGENDDFYAVRPTQEMKGYVFRTYLLDGVIEGNRVNIRLSPDLDAPVIGQLNSGDKVEGVLSTDYPKWYQIALPEKSRLYVSKEYIEKVGDAGLCARVTAKREEVQALLSRTDALVQTELEKPFDQIGIEGLKAHYQYVLNTYPEFQDLVLRAKAGLAGLQDQYNAKKMAYLEGQQEFSRLLQEKNQQLTDQLKKKEDDFSRLEQHQAIEYTPLETQTTAIHPAQAIPTHMSDWIPVEEELLNEWFRQSGQRNFQAFYIHEKERAFSLTGIIDPYHRPVKNRPGNYVLLNETTKLPIAFLYSTQVDLQKWVGHFVTIQVVPRDNHHYAFPAYFVLSIE